MKGYKTRIKRLESVRNIMTLLKITLFVVFCFFLYKWVNSADQLYGYITVPSIILFLLINKKESSILTELDLLESLVYCILNEKGYLEGNFSSFETGEEYFLASHPYAKDIDIFGDSSLYQAINRCGTPEGKDELEKALLFQEKNMVFLKCFLYLRCQNHLLWP